MEKTGNKMGTTIEELQKMENRPQPIGNIEDLVKNINENLPDHPQMDNISVRSVNEEYSPLIKKKEINLLDYVKEFILLLIVYIILSQPIVKEVIGKYLSQINPDSEGKVEIIGVVIYGVILSLSYLTLKYFLFQNQ